MEARWLELYPPGRNGGVLKSQIGPGCLYSPRCEARPGWWPQFRSPRPHTDSLPLPWIILVSDHIHFASCPSASFSTSKRNLRACDSSSTQHPLHFFHVLQVLFIPESQLHRYPSCSLSFGQSHFWSNILFHRMKVSFDQRKLQCGRENQEGSGEDDELCLCLQQGCVGRPIWRLLLRMLVKAFLYLRYLYFLLEKTFLGGSELLLSCRPGNLPLTCPKFLAPNFSQPIL